MAFIPRATFAYPAKTASWYAGHMARSMRLMGDLLPDVDLVIEARDARLPLTSINGAFDDLLAQSWGPIWNGPDGGTGSGSLGLGSSLAENLVGGKVDRKGKMREKIIAYTKRDLAEAKYEEPLIKAFRDRLDQRVLFIDNRNDDDVKQLLRIAVNAAKENPNLSPKDPLRVLVVGMPNVGKSSLLNALRRVGTKRGKHFKTSSMPGMTRKLAGVVKIFEDPLVYVHDSPGVMVPFLGHGDLGAERGLKFALTAGIKESLFESEVAVDYLLWRMNQRIAMEQHLPPEERNPTYVDVLPLPSTFTQPTEDLYSLIDPLCTKIGALGKGGQPDYNAAFAFVQKFFREGKLGRWTIDDLAPLGATGEELDWRVWQSVGQYLEMLEVQKMEAERGENLSGAQQRKKEKQEKEEKRIAKYQRMKAERGASFTRLRQKAAAARFSKRR